MFRLAFITLLLLAFTTTAQTRDAEFVNRNVLNLEENFDEHASADGKLLFAKFYAPWCGHCKRLAKTWGELAEAFDGDKNVEIAHVDCTVVGDVCRKLEIRGYPTLKVFSGGKHILYSGSRDLSSLIKFVDEQKKALLSS